jgi:hypothetical protein
MVGFACLAGDTTASVKYMVGELGRNCSGEEKERCDDGENITCACFTDLADMKDDERELM